MDNLTIVIPFRNGHHYMRQLLNSIPSSIPVVVVDDDSDKPYKAIFDERVIRQERGYFAGAVNTGLESCKTDVLILNQDVFFKGEAWLDLLMKNRATYAMIGERIKGNRDDWPHGYIHGTFMFMRRDAIDKIGGLDAEVYPLWGGTAEWQLRAARNGFKILPVATIPGFHHIRGEHAYGESITKLLNEEEKSKTDRIKMTRTPPEISVIIPIYSAAPKHFVQYLPDALNSLVGGMTSLGATKGQDFQGFEIIVVDDGSTDDVKSVVNKYLNDGWNGIAYMRINRNPIRNGRYAGKPSAMNLGIHRAKGRYITVLDADDMMEEGRLRHLWRVAQKHPHSAIYDHVMTFKGGKRDARLPMRAYDFDEILYKNSMHIGIFYPKKAWSEAGGYSTKMLFGREDWCFNVALGIQGYCGVRTEYTGYLYRRDGQNRTLVNTTPSWHRRFLSDIQSQYPGIYRGERPMGCCGNKHQTEKILRTLRNATVPGEEGMVLLTYVGSKVALFKKWGVETGTKYLIRPGQNFYVDSRDLVGSGKNIGFLDDYAAGGVSNFKVVEQPAPLPMAMSAPVVAEAAEITYAGDSGFAAMAIQEEEKPIKVEVDYSVLETISSLEAALDANNYGLPELTALLAYELENKSRKGAVSRLENKIAEIEAWQS